MLKIVIEEAKSEEKKGVSRRTGAPYTIREQQAYALLLDRAGKPLKYPVPIVVPIDQGQEPYPAGEYTVAHGSFEVGDFGGLRIGRLRLEPVAATKAVRAA